MVDLADQRETAHEQARAEKVQGLGEAGIRSSGPLDPESGAVRTAEQEQEAHDFDAIADLPPVGGNKEHDAQHGDGGPEPPEHATQAQPSPFALPRGRQRRQPLCGTRIHQPLRCRGAQQLLQLLSERRHTA